MPRKDDDFQVLITAEEAWPALERAVLEARSEIIAGFRIFDLRTKLRSPEAQEVGKDWFDLLAHAIKRGVRLHLIVSDFDPVMGTSLHETAWTTVRQGTALAEMTDAQEGQVRIEAAMHAARAGALPWIALLPAVVRKQIDRLSRIKGARRKRQAVGLGSSSLPEMHTVTHHQKLAVIDDDVLYIGGLDLNERRFDTLDHARAADETWSDVQILLRNGPEVAEAKAHLKSFVAVTDGTESPPPMRHIKRTLSAPRKVQFAFLSPRTIVNEIEEAHLSAFRSARHLIYVETQFMRSGVLADALAEAAATTPDLHLMMILPALPEIVAFDGERSLDARYGLSLQADAIETISGAFGARATFAAPVRPVMASRETPAALAGSPIVYVHNKVLVKDADYALVGSANMNGRSMRWDTEAALDITDPDRIAHLRDRLCSHWWFDGFPDACAPPETLQPIWAEEIARNGLRRPENRSGFLVPYDSGQMADHRQAVPGVTENIV